MALQPSKSNNGHLNLNLVSFKYPIFHLVIGQLTITRYIWRTRVENENFDMEIFCMSNLASVNVDALTHL